MCPPQRSFFPLSLPFTFPRTAIRLHPTSFSAGPTFNVLYDGRRNSLSPEPGYYASLIYRPNFTFPGSDSNWQSLLFDARAYKH